MTQPWACVPRVISPTIDEAPAMTIYAIKPISARRKISPLMICPFLRLANPMIRYDSLTEISPSRNPFIYFFHQVFFFTFIDEILFSIL